jgi:hypothetical protein
MAERLVLPLDEDTDDIVMRLTSEEAESLYKLLSKLSHNEMAAKGLTPDQAAAVSRILHVTY